MANLSKVILGATIAAISIASPALAAHKNKLSSAHQNGYVAQSEQRSGVRAFASAPVQSVQEGGRRGSLWEGTGP
jgi:hypothetical protein